MCSAISRFSFSVRKNPRPLFNRIYDSMYIDNYSFTIESAQLCLNFLFQSEKTQGFCFTEFTTLSMLTIILSQSNVLNFVSIFLFNQRNPRFLFLRIYHCIYIENYSLTIKCPQLCLDLFFQSNKT